MWWRNRTANQRLALVIAATTILSAAGLFLIEHTVSGGRDGGNALAAGLLYALAIGIIYILFTIGAIWAAIVYKEPDTTASNRLLDRFLPLLVLGSLCIGLLIFVTLAEQ